MRIMAPVSRAPLLAIALVLVVAVASANTEAEISLEASKSAASSLASKATQTQQCPEAATSFVKAQGANDALGPQECSAASASAASGKAALEAGRTSQSELRVPFVGVVSNDMLKLMLQTALSAINVSSWLIPLSMANFGKHKRLLGIANAFSGGIFLAMACGHMLPQSQESFEALSMSPMNAFYAALAGYLTIFFVERVAFDAQNEPDHDADDEHDEQNQSKDRCHQHSNQNGQNGTSDSQPTQKVEAHHNDHAAAAQRSAGVLVLTLAVHSFFETMALGLSDTPLTTVLMGASIGLHQPAESIALLVTLLKTGMDKTTIARWLVMFSLVGPAGVATGVFVNQVAPPFMDALVVGLAAGTFLYVGATEIIPEEFENATRKERWLKFLVLVAGVISILTITRVTSEWEEVGAHNDSV